MIESRQHVRAVFVSSGGVTQEQLKLRGDVRRLWRLEASLQTMMFTLKISFQDKQPEFILQQRCESGDEGGGEEVAKLSVFVCVWVAECVQRWWGGLWHDRVAEGEVGELKQPELEEEEGQCRLAGSSWGCTALGGGALLWFLCCGPTVCVSTVNSAEAGASEGVPGGEEPDDGAC